MQIWKLNKSTLIYAFLNGLMFICNFILVMSSLISMYT